MPSDSEPVIPKAPRITSIDALRGLVMFTMIFVNDLAGAPERLVPDWMAHFGDRHPHGGSGMTFVDLVFPGFLFIVGMSIPFALGPRLARGESVWKILGHILIRTLALLAIGILMVNGESGGTAPWYALMFLSSILAFCQVTPRGGTPESVIRWKQVTLALRGLGFAGMLYSALAFNHHGHHILNFAPFSIHTSWYGILGLIGWAYLAASLIFLVFRGHRTALLACVALMTCFYAADRHQFFDHFWPAHFVDFGGTLGSQAAITVAGLLLASMLVAADMTALKARVRFTLWFIGGFALAAWLVTSLYGISKNEATPAWCFWADAITAALWLGFYFCCDVHPVKIISRPLAAAGQNVLLAYLLSEMQESVFDLLHLGDWYDGLAQVNLAAAIARSIGCTVVILLITVGLNRVGFRLKL
jgi:predicted acyltransferase